MQFKRTASGLGLLEPKLAMSPGLYAAPSKKRGGGGGGIFQLKYMEIHVWGFY